MVKKKKAKGKPKTTEEIIKTIIEKEGMCNVLQVLHNYADAQADIAEDEQAEAEEKVSGWESVMNSIDSMQGSLGNVNDC